MKQLLNYNPAFTPGAAGAGTLDFSQFGGFDRTRLYAVINITQNIPLYIAGAPGLGMASNSAGSLVVLSTSTATYASTDVLNVYYETDAGLYPLENNDAAERNGNLDKISQLMEQVLIELKVQNVLLKEGLNIKDELERLRADIQVEDQR
jgi:short-subunit dehydrogenase